MYYRLTVFEVLQALFKDVFSLAPLAVCFSERGLGCELPTVRNGLLIPEAQSLIWLPTVIA